MFIAVLNEIRDEYKSKGSFSVIDIGFTILPSVLIIIKSTL